MFLGCWGHSGVLSAGALGGVLSASTAFTTFSLLNLLKQPIEIMPRVIADVRLSFNCLPLRFHCLCLSVHCLATAFP